MSTSHEKLWNLGFGLAGGVGPAPGIPDKTLLDLHFLLVGASLGTSGTWFPPVGVWGFMERGRLNCSLVEDQFKPK